MNANEYINSGAIEAYIHGLADEADIALQLEMEGRYPEVQAARMALEEQMEQQALQMPLANPAATRERILNALKDEKAHPTKVVAMPTDLKAAPKPIRWFRTALAASVLLLMGSVLLNFYFYSQYTDFSNRYEELSARQNVLANKANALEASMHMIKSPKVQPVVMQGVTGNAGMMATVYYDKSTTDVYLMVNNLPMPQKGKQYQLWAQVDGQMVDAGLLTWTDEAALVKMSRIANAQAFAISLEPEGGSKVPTLTEVKVLGKA